MANFPSLLSPGFVVLNLQFALVTAIAALFFAFAGYLQQLGISPAMAGFVLSADALAALVVQPLISPLIHSGTARRWLVGGSLLLATALLMLGQVTSLPLLAGARLVQGAGFITVLSALITMTIPFIPPGMSGRAFGILSLVRLIPYALIPLLFNLLAIAPDSFARVLNLAALTALAPVLALLLPVSQQAGKEGHSRPPGLSGLSASLRSAPILLLLASALLFFCGYATIFFFLTPYGLSRGIANAGLFFTIATLVMIVVRLFGSGIFDRYNKVQLCMAGLLLTTLCYGLLPFCASSRMLFIIAGLAGLGWGITMPVQAAAMFDISSPSVRAMNQNLLMVMLQGGFFLGPFLGGVLIAHFGYIALFAFLAALSLLAGLLLLGIRVPVIAEGESR